jgi:hypothetical protein
MKAIIQCRQFFIAMLIAIGCVAIGAVAWADGTVTYKGQGFNFDGTTYSLNDERCGLEGQTAANDGGTGQFADWNGPGQPYKTGDPYLVWVLTAKGATAASIHLPDGDHAMFAVGGTFKYASGYWTRDTLVNLPVTASYTGTANNPQLVVSHGCAPHKQGAWCSPGYWKNTLNKSPTNGWTTIGVDPLTAMFNGNVSPLFYANNINPDALLTYVLNNPGSYGGSLGTAGPYGLTAFNAVGAYLTSLIPGYQFDPSLVGDETACPIDAFGKFK